jgi:hypothetical protein
MKSRLNNLIWKYEVEEEKLNRKKNLSAEDLVRSEFVIPEILKALRGLRG